MSATSENLAEQIRLLDEQIHGMVAIGQADSPAYVELKNRRRSLMEQLHQANQALTEGKQILKG